MTSRGACASDALRPLVVKDVIETKKIIGSDITCRSIVTQSVKEDVTTQSVVTRTKIYWNY